MGDSCFVSIRLSLFLSALSRVLSLVGTLGDVTYVSCYDMAFLNISANFSNAFKSSVPGDRKGGDGNGFLRAPVTSISDFVTREFGDKDGN